MRSIKKQIVCIVKQEGFIFLLFIFISCSDQRGSSGLKTGQDTLMKRDAVSESVNPEDRIVNAVMALPEVEQANHYIDSISDHKKGVSAIYDGKEEGSSDVCVRIGYSSDERFEVYYFFYVDPNSMQIKIQDIINDTIILVEEWRKQKASAG